MALVSLSSYTEEFGRSIQLPKCNRDACDDKFAPCFNTGTKTYYCIRCARDVNFAPMPDGSYLCEIPEINEALSDLERACYEGKQYVGTRMLKDVPELLNTGYTAEPSKETSAVREELTGRPGDQWRRATADIEPVTAGVRKGDFVIFTGRATLAGMNVLPDLPVGAVEVPLTFGIKLSAQAQAETRRTMNLWFGAYDQIRAHRKTLNKRKKQARARTGRRS